MSFTLAQPNQLPSQIASLPDRPNPTIQSQPPGWWLEFTAKGFPFKDKEFSPQRQGYFAKVRLFHLVNLDQTLAQGIFGQFDPVVQIKFFHDITTMRLNRFNADEEPVGNFPIGKSLSYEP